MSRVEDALAEIARREVRYQGKAFVDVQKRWVLDVLRGDRAVLEQHEAEEFPADDEPAWCAYCPTTDDWPCPDAARVLNRYAPEPTP